MNPKVLFLARWYPDRYDPMTGLFIKRHAEVAAGFTDVAVLYLRAAHDIKGSYHIEQFIENGVATTIVYYGTKSTLPKFLIKWLAAFKFIKAFILGYKAVLRTWYKPDIIHVNVLTRLGILALYMRMFHNIRYVITEHWSRYLAITGTYKGFFRKMVTKIVVRNASAISTVSINLASAMQSHGLQNDHYMILPNVVSTDVYIPAGKKNTKNRIRFMHISCFEDRSKNISGILRAISKLLEVRNDFECIMVGEGVDFAKIQQLASELNLKEPVLAFTGLLENEDLVKAYQSSCFTVMFSNYENMPVVISESFACGLPVVATAVGGIPEYINEKTGLLVPVADEDELVKAISFMLDHYTEFDKQLLRNTAVQTFSTSAVADKLKELYGFVTN